MRGVVAATAVLVLVLSGCASTPASGDAASSSDPGVDVHATDTTGVIRGIVVDNAIRPLEHATVTVKAAGKTLTNLTNANGGFGFEGLEPGTYFVQAGKLGYKAGQTSVEVVAGVSDPEVKRISLDLEPSTRPYVESVSYTGYLECGVAVFYTSVGCTTEGFLADATGSQAIWNIKYSILPNWTQGELIWDQTQQAGGDLIWEAVWAGGSGNSHCGHRETTVSPALAYMNNSVLHAKDKNWAACTDQTGDHVPDFMADGINYRFFGGPHPACIPPDTNLPSPAPANPLHFGCGVTLEQKTQAVIHNFYNWVPNPGWRFTKDGTPKPPA